MPEGPESRLQADSLQRYVGKTVIGFTIEKNSRFRKERYGIKGLKNVKLPIHIESIWTRGKIIVFEGIDKLKEKIYLVSHLGMAGRWSGERQKHSDFSIKFGRKSNSQKGKWCLIDILYFDDPRHFGNFGVYKDLSEVWKKHGPCLMCTSLRKYENVQPNKHQKTLTENEYVEIISNSRLSDKILYKFMLEQRHLAGVGNYLAAELLYECKISPHRKLSGLNDKEKRLLYHKSLEIIYQSYKAHGPTAGYISDGSFELKVYQRDYDPLGNSVIKEKINNRTIHWVPNVQK